MVFCNKEGFNGYRRFIGETPCPRPGMPPFGEGFCSSAMGSGN
jgi:hypothetical protein